MLEWVRDGLWVDSGRPMSTGKMAGDAGWVDVGVEVFIWFSQIS